MLNAIYSHAGNNCFTNGFQSEILPHGKVKLVDEYLFEGIQIVLLVEESAHFEPKNIIKGIVFEPIPSIKKVGFCDCY